MRQHRFWHFAIFTALTTAFMGCSYEPAAPQHTQQWQLVWEDDFNGSSLDTAVWSVIPADTSIDWRRYMSPDTALYSVQGGQLTLRAAVNPRGGQPYMTAGVYTRNKKAFQPGGYIEIKAKLQGGKGLWPAIWMLPEGNWHWPEGGEVDIMERLNNEPFVHQTVHSPYTVDLQRTQNPPATATARIDPDGFNTYGVAIYADSVVFYVNGQRTFTYPRVDGGANGQYPYYHPMYLLLDMQLGGWAGTIDADALPASMTVDYVRYYRR